MKLYFTNDSRQKKLLIESDYAEDIYDTTLTFFEEKRRFPHYLHLEEDKQCVKITFGSATECFLVEDYLKDDYEELQELYIEHDIL